VTAPHTVLVIEDETSIASFVAAYLRNAGYVVTTAASAQAALLQLAGEVPALVILDLNLPDGDGVELCRRIRKTSDVPILMLTARDAEVDRVLGLELGADDYVTKPFSTAELISRVRAILRRRELDREPQTRSELRVGGIAIDLARHTVVVDGRQVDVTPSEFRLLLLLAEEPERVFTRGQIMEHLWRTPYLGETRACDAHISNLRKKIERDPAHPERILTVRETGYKLVSV
jgi:two-component system response regulator RegX3